MQTKEELSPVLKVITILEKNGYRVLKAEEEMAASCVPRGSINLLVTPNKKLPDNSKAKT